MFDNFFGGFLDFNGDGKIDVCDEAIGYEIFNQVTNDDCDADTDDFDLDSDDESESDDWDFD
jgi:hypothetical protein